MTSSTNSLPKAKSPTTLLTGTAALAAVSTASSQGALVQINLSNNQISAFSNTLNADLTGDLTDDVTFTGEANFFSPFMMPMVSMIPISTTAFGAMISTTFTFPGNPGTYSGEVRINGQLARGFNQVDSNGGPTSSVAVAPGGTPGGLGIETGGITLTFSDPGIFGGATTTAFLEVVAEGTPANAGVTLTRLVFDDGVGAPVIPSSANVVGQGAFPDYVPEPSSLALLALGAGGLTFRRQRKKA